MDCFDLNPDIRTGSSSMKEQHGWIFTSSIHLTHKQRQLLEERKEWISGVWQKIIKSVFQNMKEELGREVWRHIWQINSFCKNFFKFRGMRNYGELYLADLQRPHGIQAVRVSGEFRGLARFERKTQPHGGAECRIWSKQEDDFLSSEWTMSVSQIQKN